MLQIYDCAIQRVINFLSYNGLLILPTGEGHVSPAIEASDNDQQKMAKLEAMIRVVEQAVNKCSNRNEGRDKQRT